MTFHAVWRLTLFAILGVAACVPGASEVKVTAARDLGCAQQITVTQKSLAAAPLFRNPDDVLYEAAGCGKRIEYWVKGREIRQHHGEWYAPR
jgi:hypothetical protein